LLYSASDIAILTPEQLATHPFLLRVGPDVLDMTLTAESVKARLLSARFRGGSFPLCCWIRRFWPGWETIYAWRFSGRWG
jgi:hypothetical protein